MVFPGWFNWPAFGGNNNNNNNNHHSGGSKNGGTKHRAHTSHPKKPQKSHAAQKNQHSDNPPKKTQGQSTQRMTTSRRPATTAAAHPSTSRAAPVSTTRAAPIAGTSPTSSPAVNVVPSTSSTAADLNGKNTNSLSGGQTAGAAIGAILGIFVIVALLVWATRRYRHKKTHTRSASTPGLSDWRGVTPIGLIRSASSRLGFGGASSRNGWHGADNHPLPEDQHAILGRYAHTEVVPIGRPSFVNRMREEGGHDPHAYGHQGMGMGGRHADMQQEQHYEDYDNADLHGIPPMAISNGHASISPSFEVMQVARDQPTSSAMVSRPGDRLHQRTSSLAKGIKQYDDEDILTAPRAPALAASSPMSSPRLATTQMRYRYDPSSNSEDINGSPALGGRGQFATLRGGSPRTEDAAYLGSLDREQQEQRRRMEEEQARQVANASGATLRVAKPAAGPGGYRESVASAYSTESGAALAPKGGATSQRYSYGMAPSEMDSSPPVFPAKTSVFDPYTHISRLYDPSIADDIRRALADRPETAMSKATDGERQPSYMDDTESVPELPAFLNELATVPRATIAQRPDSRERQHQESPEDYGAAAFGIGNMLASEDTSSESESDGEAEEEEEEEDEEEHGSYEERQVLQKAVSASRVNITQSPAPRTQPSSNSGASTPGKSPNTGANAVLLPAPAAWRAGAIAASGVRRNRTSSQAGHGAA